MVIGLITVENIVENCKIAQMEQCLQFLMYMFIDKLTLYHKNESFNIRDEEGLRKHLKEKDKMLVTSISSNSINYFCLFKDSLDNLSYIQIIPQ